MDRVVFFFHSLVELPVALTMIFAPDYVWPGEVVANSAASYFSLAFGLFLLSTTFLTVFSAMSSVVPLAVRRLLLLQLLMYHFVIVVAMPHLFRISNPEKWLQLHFYLASRNVVLGTYIHGFISIWIMIAFILTFRSQRKREL